MRRPLFAALAIVAVPLFAACSPYSLTDLKAPPTRAFGPSARSDVGVVCVARPSHFALGVTFVVHDNKQLVGATRGESYFCYEAEAGEHFLVSSTGDPIDSDGTARLAVEAGRRYWLHQDFDNVLGFVTAKLQWVDETRWRELVDDAPCQYKVLSGVPGDEALPGDLPFARSLASVEAQHVAKN